MKKGVLVIDQGTTGTTALIVDQETLKVVGTFNQEFPQHYPEHGKVEHDLNEIWNSCEAAVTKLLDAHPNYKSNISCIGITNQRETTCAFRKDGTILSRAIVWQDSRTKNYCQKLQDNDPSRIIHLKTGLTYDPYFSGTKMKWLLHNNNEVDSAFQNKDLYLTTVDSFVLGKLTNFESVFTDPTNASRTLLMDLDTGYWHPKLCSMLNISPEVLAPIKDSFGELGKTKKVGFLPDGIPITCILGDQQAALFGQSGFSDKKAKCTYGTGAFLLLNTGDNIMHSEKGLLTTVAYQHEGKRQYALEGSCYIAGAAVQWLRDELNLISSAPETEELASTVTLKEMEELTFFPFFTGIGTPHWKANTQAAIIGLRRNTSKGHLVRSVLEGIALSVQDVLMVMEEEIGHHIDNLYVDGGGANNNLLCQMQANFGPRNVLRPTVTETTAFGAALGALIGAKIITTDDMQVKMKNNCRTFQQEKMTSLYYTIKKRRWEEYIAKLYF